MDCARFLCQRNVRPAQGTVSILHGVAILGQLSHAQVIDDMDNSTVVHNSRKGRARVGALRSLLRAPFELKMRKGVWLSLRWIPPEANVEAAGITPPGWNELVHLRLQVFAKLSFYGFFHVGLLHPGGRAGGGK